MNCGWGVLKINSTMFSSHKQINDVYDKNANRDTSECI